MSDENENQVPTSKFDVPILVAVAAFSFLLTILAFMPSLGASYLLDEKFIVAWSSAIFKGTTANGLGNMLAWRGPVETDCFGPFSSFICMFVSQTSPAFARLLSMISHAGCSVALFMVARQLTRGLANYVSLSIAISAALIFSVSPLSTELISYLGGMGIELSILFFLLSFNFYLGGHPIFGTPKKNYSILSVVFFVLTILAYTKAWLLAKVFFSFELLNFILDPDSRKSYKSLWQEKTSESRHNFLTTLGAIVVTSVIAMFIELARGANPIGSIFALLPAAKNMILALLFPINRSIWTKYSPEYIFLYIIFGLAVALSAVGIFRNTRYRVLAAFSVLWMLCGVFVGGDSSLIANDFYGSRFLAHASVAFALGLATFTFGLASAFQLPFKTGLIPGIIICILFTVSSSRHAFNQCFHYKNSAKLLEKIEKSVKIICAKEKTEYAVVRDLPRQISLTPTVSPFRPLVMDGQSGLMRSPIVSGGFVKDALKNPQTNSVVARWDKTYASLLPVLTDPKTNDPAIQFDAFGLAKKLIPPLKYWKTVSMDNEEKCLKIESNSEHSPGINLALGYLSPIDGDIFYIDAKIDTPVEPKDFDVELHWISIHNDDFEKEDRRSTVKAIINDNTYHRYMVSLRSTGWATNGTISSLTLGFPSSATVRIREAGIISGDGVFPQIALEPLGNAPKAQSSFAQLCFNFPNDKRLGLCRLNKDTPDTKISYDFSSIAGSASGTLISSMPDQFSFKTDAGPLPADLSFKSTLTGTKGETQISRGQFPRSGIYGLRAVAQNPQGEPLSKYSDTIWILVDLSN
ncbi:MAG: hypothetical protein IAF58_10710 [Leptolyngbya sp.]|nr:hypothetical protein [Candidatus Melainabacteria bacterium]